MDRPRCRALVAFRAVHREGLARPGLTVREHGHVVAIGCRLHEVAAIFEDLLLRARSEDSVEGELLVLHLHRHLVHGLTDAGVALARLLFAQGPDPAKDADGAFQVLHGIVKLLAPLVDGYEVRFGDAGCECFLQRSLQLLSHLSESIDALHVHLLRLCQHLIDALQQLLLLLFAPQQLFCLGILSSIEVGFLAGRYRSYQASFRHLLASLCQLLSSKELGFFHPQDFLSSLNKGGIDVRLLGLLNGELQALDVALRSRGLQRSLHLFLRLGRSNQVLHGLQLRGAQPRGFGILQCCLQHVDVAGLLGSLELLPTLLLALF
mmetsp:Transcript_6953/g.16378  ORF Transcript_6953/g.16378 Transcript_6953/m.16378 type:complete len:321 (+) Transcript_6953:757-1719(+)